jgi:disulfide bond formation protein DsbB
MAFVRSIKRNRRNPFVIEDDMTFTQRPLPWFLLALSAIFLEVGALYFQYGLKLDPCVLCIYQRAAILGIFIAAVIGMSAPRSFLARGIAYLGWCAAALWCLYLALKLSGIQLGFVSPSLSCDVNAKFPVWLKLDQWLPSVFQPHGFCGDIQWQFLELSIPQWLALVMTAQLLVFCFVIAVEIRSMLRS